MKLIKHIMESQCLCEENNKVKKEVLNQEVFFLFPSTKKKKFWVFLYYLILKRFVDVITAFTMILVKFLLKNTVVVGGGREKENFLEKFKIFIYCENEVIFNMHIVQKMSELSI